MSETGHERWNDDVAAYMLGALEPHEVEELERHLERCELCRDQMRWLRPAVRALPDGVQRLEPPPQLRQRIFVEAGITPRSSAAAIGLRRWAAGWARRLGSSRRGWRPAAAALLATLALALVAVIAFGIGTYGGNDYVPPTSTYTWGKEPGITAELTREGSHGTLRLEHVDQPEGDKVLEAWVKRDRAVEPVPALFVPDNEGRAWATIEEMDGVDAVLVTEEPKGGSEQPTSTPLLEMECPSSG